MIQIPAPDAGFLVDRDQLTGSGPIKYRCDAIGHPDPTITWYYNGAVVQSGSGGVVVSGNGTLTIPAPQVSHSGVYQCVAANTFGEDRRAWILEVEEREVAKNIIGLYKFYSVVNSQSVVHKSAFPKKTSQHDYII